jgi:hypothetical protein
MGLTYRNRLKRAAPAAIGDDADAEIIEFDEDEDKGGSL